MTRRDGLAPHGLPPTFHGTPGDNRTLIPKNVRALRRRLHQPREEPAMTNEDTTIMDETELTIIHGQPDERFAGTPLDSWRGYTPMPSVITAIEKAIERPGVAMIAYAHELPDDAYRLTDNHQRRAARAWAAEHHPHLKVSVGTEVVPFRSVGSDCRVFKVSVGTERRKG